MSSFGFGGSNFHVSVEEHTGGERAPRLRSLSHELVLLSAADGAGVADQARALAERASQSSGASAAQAIAWFAHSSQQEFNPKDAARLAILASVEGGGEDLAAKLRKAAAKIEEAPEKPFSAPNGTHYGTGPHEGSVAFLFPGQGSQYLGMGADLAMAFDRAREPWDRAADLDFDPETGLHDVVFPPPSFDDQATQTQGERLTATEWAQPAIVCTSLGQLALLRELGVEAAAVAGHSLGEVTALHAAGLLSAQDVLGVARRRGELMAQAASVPGSMTAVSGALEEVREAVAQSGEDAAARVVVANHNSPTQVVLSGAAEAIEHVETSLKQRGLRPRRLPVASAFHSPVVAGASVPLRQHLEDVAFGEAAVPVYSNAQASTYPTDPDAIRDRLATAVAEPVRFVEMLEAMAASGVETFIEVGPGSVLSGLVQKTLKNRARAVSLDRKGKSGIQMLFDALGRLAAAGVELTLSALWDEYREVLDPAAAAPSKMAVQINGTNYEKLYPPPGGAADLPTPNPEPVAKELATPSAPQAKAEARAAAPQPAAPQPAAPQPAAPQPAAPTPPPAVLEATPARAPEPAPLVTPTPQAFQAPALSPAVAPALTPGWLDAWQEAQRQTAEAHSTFQQAMGDTHAAYLQTAQAALEGLAGIGGSKPSAAVQSLPVAAPTPTPQPLTVAPSAPVEAAPAIAPQPPAPQPKVEVRPAAPQPKEIQPAAPQPSEIQPVAPQPVAPPAQVAERAPVAAAAPSAPENTADLEGLMLEVVAEKTGYPSEMLSLGMELEADLGIDSIKRVEILAAFEEQAPDLPTADPAQLGALKTLGEIVEHMRALAPTAPSAGSEAPAAAAAPSAAAAEPAAATADFEALMLDVVADKTGYPSEMLSLGMELEADLGIDSIKRVEILAAFEEQAPGLPAADPAQLGALKTLGEIVEHMRALAPATAPSGPEAPAPSASATAAEPAAATADFEALMLDVVADKTGYPSEMLSLGMELEADLGIDSIKRVEILAAFEEQAPDLPAADPAQLGALKTLGEIVEHMRALAPTTVPSATAPSATAPNAVTPEPANGSAPPAPVAPAATTAANEADLQALMMDVVADKTGYPSEMLSLDMELEADLGIDSIKRVEILAAFEEQAPDLPPADPAKLGALKTLGEIVEHMRAETTTAEAPTAEAPTAEAPTAEAPATVAATEGVPAASNDTAPSPGRYALELVEAPPLGLALPGLFSADQVLVTDDGSGIAQALATRLEARGVPAGVVQEVPEGASAVIFLDGLRALTSAADAIAVNPAAFRAARTVAAGVAERGGLLVTVQDTGGTFGLGSCDPLRAWSAGLPALVKTAAHEWTQAAGGPVSLRAIDLDRGDRDPDALAAVLEQELYRGGIELEIGLGRDGTRRTLNSVESEVARGDAAIEPGDVVVVSGGARGVTAAAMVEWARECQGRFVLLGRTELDDEPACCAGIADDAGLKRALLEDAKQAGSLPTPAELGRTVRTILANREIRGTVNAIAATGGEARYVAADVTDLEVLGAALAAVRADWGPIRGFVHGAGVLADKRIAELEDTAFDRVFNTKIEGLRTLLAATADDPIRLICLFSSVAARCGNQGQAAYAMANEVLNKVAWAESRRRGEDPNGGALVKSMGWGPWEGGMVSPELKAHFAAMGVPLIPLEAGGRMLADELHGAQPDQVELVLGGDPQGSGVLSASPEERSVRMEQLVSDHTHSYLAGHSIQGTPVVPVVMAIEWLARMARAFRPDLELSTIYDIRVLRGIRLDGFRNGGDRLTLTCRQQGDGDLALEILGADNKPHYRARAGLVERREAANGYVPERLALEAWNGAPIYDGDVLFHDGAFQVIEQIEGISDAGAKAVLRGLDLAQWDREAWQTDVAAFDGGLQLAVLWAQRMLGGATLPTAISEFRTWTGGPPEGPIHCQVVGTETHRSRTVSNIVFLDRAGNRFAELRGVETHLRPDLEPVASAHS